MLPFPACSIVYRWLNQTIPLIFSAVKVLFFMGLILSVLVLLQNQEIASIFALFSIDYPGLTTGIILELCRMLTGFS
jgi:alanine-alpha-ketoisovalerate/valine-pyruvate aminotransferase